MGEDIYRCGYIKLAGENDRASVATILFKNGYTVSTVRRKKNGKTYEYYVKYELLEKDITDTEG